jgi:ribosome recycling factor
MEEELEMTLLEGEEKMDKATAAYERELSTVRTGRVAPGLLDTVYFEYYGAKTQIKNAATITVPESNQLLIKPYDKSSVKDIEKAILASPLGLTPQSEGTQIRLILPKMTVERRRELVKYVSKLEETAKVTIRNARRDLNDDIKKLGLPEDTEANALEDAQKLTDKKIQVVSEMTERKSKDLMTI